MSKENVEAETAASAPGPQPSTPAVGSLVTLVGGHPKRPEGKSEPVGRVFAVEPASKLVGEGKAAREAPDGEFLKVTWPSLRLESKHRAEELKVEDKE